MSDTPPNPPPDPSKPPEGQPDPNKPEGDKPPEPKKPEDQIKDLEAAISEERKLRREAESKFSKLEREHMSEQEKAIATAKDEGRKEAVQSAGRRLAAAEFKAQAAGKIADPAAALELFDLSKFVGADGEPDTTAIARLVERLTPAMAPPATGRVPAGPRGDDNNGGTDFIRQAMGRGR
jgi:vacuolar-type H+-ATPase subunit H